MHRIQISGLAAAVLLTGLLSNAKAAPLGTGFIYQARITLDGAPLNDTADFEFSLYDAEMDGLLVSGPIVAADVDVVDGLFEIELDFGEEVLSGDARWLEVAVRSPHDPGDSDPLTLLEPRQPVTAAPVALSLRGLRTSESGDAVSPESWNLVGGHAENSVAADVAGGTVAGGGRPGFANHVTANFGTVIGGVDNMASGIGATVAGGSGNEALGQSAIVAGGSGNRAQGDHTLAGGSLAHANHDHTFVWNGDDCDLCAPFASTAPGQFLIRAGGGVGIGTSSPSNQLSVQGNADFSGNVGIGTTGSGAQLAVEGQSGTQTVRFTGAEGNFRFLQDLDGGGLASWSFRNAGSGSPDVKITTAGDVGIGTTSPQARLHVIGGDGLLVSDSSNETLLRVDGTGKVGINAPSPLAPLHVVGASLFNGEIWSVNSLAQTVLFAGDSGKVGIGTPTPASTLHVAGDAQIDGDITIAPATRFLNVSANAFAVGSSITVSLGIDTRTALLRTTNYNQTATAIADVTLPHGAVVTGFSAAMKDLGPDHDVQVRLRRLSTSTESANANTLAQVFSTGAGGFQVVTDDTVAFSQVNSQTHMYEVRVNFPTVGDGSEPLLVFYNAQIEYTVTAPLP